MHAPARPPRYQNYTLSGFDLELLLACAGPAGVVYPRANPPPLLVTAWNVLAEKHRFQVQTAAQHPDGLPYVLAVPAHVLRQKRGDFEDVDHYTPNR